MVDMCVLGGGYISYVLYCWILLILIPLLKDCLLFAVCFVLPSQDGIVEYDY